MLFEDASGYCPHCNESIAIPIDPGGGQKQEIYIDCEVCCRSIFVRCSWSAETEEYQVELSQG